MKLSSVEMVSEYRATLKALRLARNAVVGEQGNKLVCKTWHMGVEHDFCMLLTKGVVRHNLTGMLDREIVVVKREIEAHGVDVDE